MKTFLRMALPLALLIAAPLQAQTTLGVKGGINIATVDTNVSDVADLVDSKTGFVGGGFVTLGLGSLFALQPELLYSQKGFQVDEFGETVKFNTNYIEIPVLLKAQFKLAMLRPAVYAGPVLSFETGCSVSALELSVDCDDEVADVGDRKKNEWGAVFGANLDLILGSITLILDGRYQLGLTNLADVPDSDDSVKNSLWQIMAGVGFTL
jgi:hypothetical protein